jgi:hypothetical protein
MLRGSANPSPGAAFRVAVISPKEALVNVAVGGAQLVWLNRLKISTRNCPLILSLKIGKYAQRALEFHLFRKSGRGCGQKFLSGGVEPPSGTPRAPVHCGTPLADLKPSAAPGMP